MNLKILGAACCALLLASAPYSVRAQDLDRILGKWSDSSDKKTCDIPVGSSPDVATTMLITQRGISYYEIDCAARDVRTRGDGADFELDCFKGGGAARWFETASVRSVGSDRVVISFTNRKPSLGSNDGHTETLYRCPVEKGDGLSEAKPSISQWKHNGSIMSLSEYERGNIEIAYVEPRSGMLGVGVRANTTLFLGRLDKDQVEGTAYVFNPICGPIGYEVNGRFLDGKNTLLLSGMTPRVNRNCDVIKEVSEALRFERLN